MTETTNKPGMVFDLDSFTITINDQAFSRYVSEGLSIEMGCCSLGKQSALRLGVTQEEWDAVAKRVVEDSRDEDEDPDDTDYYGDEEAEENQKFIIVMPGKKTKWKIQTFTMAKAKKSIIPTYLIWTCVIGYEQIPLSWPNLILFRGEHPVREIIQDEKTGPRE